MSNTVTINMSLEDRGKTVQKKTQEVQGLNSELQKTTKLASQALRSGPKAAGFAPEIEEYGRLRGSAGRTGAGARDFANEAQGLGGLVRLYATYAANVFAVSAAFTALRDAMNTTMMIKGLDQLGAASGVALGGLAKQFSAVTDGAISLRESMEATTKAVSSGLSQQQFLELGKVAKGASQALGVNMSDAVSRLTRGITKLEPELLDELGIFTKVGKATEDYAKSVGKSVNSLTDFERRQAFANAVLEEGRQKFGQIAMESNPYDQLLASLKDVAQTILSTVNTVIAPVAKLLADNTLLIGAAIAAAGLKIVNQALPALAQWQKGLAAAADDAAKKASEITESFGGRWVEIAEAREDIPKIQKELALLNTTITTLESSRGTEAAAVTAKLSGYEKSSKTLAILKKQEVLSEQEIAKITTERNKAQARNTEAAKLQIAAIERRLALEKQISDTIAKRNATNITLQERFGKVEEASMQPSFGEWQRAQLSRDAQVKAARLSLISTVASNVEQGGLGTLREFFKEVDADTRLAGRSFDILRTKGTGALIGIATAARLAGSALMGFISGPLQAAIFAYTIMDTLFSKNAKQLSEFNSQLDLNTETVKTATNVAERFGNTLSTESINAKANAFTSLSDTIAGMTTALSAADKAASGFDRLIDGFKSLFGADLKTKYSEDLANSIFAAIQQIPEGEARSQLEAKIRSITGTSDLSAEGLKKSINSIPKEKIVSFGKDAQTALDKYGRSLKDAQAYTQDIVTSQKSLQESLAAVARASVKITELDTALINIAKSTSALQKAFTNTTSGAVAFADILSGKININILDTESAMATLTNAKAFKVLQSQAKDLENQIASVQKAAEKVQNPFSNVRRGTEFRYMGAQVDTSMLIELKKGETALRASLEKVRKEQQSYLLNQSEILAKAAEKVAISQLSAFNSKLSEISLRGQMSRLDKLPIQTEESISRRAAIESRLVDAQLSQTTATNNLILAQEDSKLAIEQNTRAYLENIRQQALAKGDTDTARRIGAELNQTSRGIVDYTALRSALQKGDVRAVTSSQYISQQAKDALQGVTLARAQAAQDKANIQLTKEQAIIQQRYSKTVQELDQKIFDLSNTIQLTTDVSTKTALEEQVTQLKLQKAAEQFRNTIALTEAVVGKGKVPVDVQVEAGRQYALAAGQITGEAATRLGTTAQESQKAADAAIKSLAQENILVNANRDVAQQNLNIKEQELAKSYELGNLSERSYQLQLQQISNSRIDLELQSKLEALQKSITDKIIGISELLNKEGLTDAQKEALQGFAVEANNAYNIAVNGAIAWANAQKANTTLLTDEQQRLKNFNEFGQNLFTGLGDSIVEFAKTGKFSFKDMVTDMIADLARLEMKMLMMKTYEATGGLGNLLSKVLPNPFGESSAISSTAPIVGAPVAPSMAVGPVFAAQGAAFDQGMLKFAKGGAFTNQVVNTPTKFKFAQGVGLMGEAGAEAIMPLQRDSRGNLGVRADGGGSKVDVVVNNYSNQPAEAKETVDSRGNRRIEVTIGEMVASEVARSNSPVNQSIKNSFAARPNLIRR